MKVNVHMCEEEEVEEEEEEDKEEGGGGEEEDTTDTGTKMSVPTSIIFLTD